MMMNQKPFLTTENTEDTDKACFVLFCLQSRSVLSVVKLFCFSPVLEKSLILSPGILAVLCILTLSASGQELILEPRFSVSYEHSDNLFLSPEISQTSEDDSVQTPVSDSMLVLTPGVSANLTGRRARLSLSYDFGHTQYDKNSELDDWRHNARFTGEGDLTPDTVLLIRNQFLRTEDPLSSPQYEVNRDPESLTDPDPTTPSLREPYSIYTSLAGLAHHFSDSDSIYAEYSHSARNEDSALADEYVRHGVRSRYSCRNDSGWGGELEGELSQSDFELSSDTDTWSGILNVSKKLTSSTMVFGQYNHQYVEYTEESDESGGTYHVLNPEAGMTYTSPRGDSLALTAGFFQRDQKHGSDTSGLSGTLNLNRQFERSAITLFAATGHDDSIYAREQTEASTFHEAGVRLGYTVSRAVNLSLYTSYRQDDYDDIDATDAEPEDETSLVRSRGDGESLGAGIALAYQPRSWCALQFNYSVRDRSADRPEDEYEENRASVMLRISAPYRSGSVPAAQDTSAL
jgi:hypothetical protein